MRVEITEMTRVIFQVMCIDALGYESGWDFKTEKEAKEYCDSLRRVGYKAKVYLIATS